MSKKTMMHLRSMFDVRCSMFDVRATLFLVCAVALFLAHGAYLRCVAEDSFIAFRFAHNLAQGHGFVWNIGEPPVEGFTNFLWVVACAGAIRLGWNVILFAQAAGVAAGVATLLCLYRTARRCFGCSRGAAAAACLAAACSGPLAAWAGSGMETVPFAFAVLLGVHWMLRFLQEQRLYHGMAGALALMTATLLRPEGFMVAGVICGLCWLLWDTQPGRTRRFALIPPAVFGALFTVYFAWRWRHFGFPLPNTFYAKTGGGLPQQARGLKYALDFAVFYVLPLLPLTVLAAWEKGKSGLGTRNSERRTGNRECRTSNIEHRTSNIEREATDNGQQTTDDKYRTSNIERETTGYERRTTDETTRNSQLATRNSNIERAFVRHAPVVVCLTLVLVYAAYIVYVGGDYMAMYRFWVPLVPLLCLLFGWAAEPLFAAARGLPRKCLAGGVLGATCLALLWPSTPLEAVVMRKPVHHHGRFQGVFRERWHTARLTVIGHFFRQYRHDYSETLATDAIGAVGYYSDMKVLDLHGLTDTHIAHLKEGRTTLGSGFPGHEKGDLAYIVSKRPTYFMFSRALTKEPLGWPAFGAELEPIVHAAYELKSAWISDPGNGEEGCFTFLARKDENSVIP